MPPVGSNCPRQRDGRMCEFSWAGGFGNLLPEEGSRTTLGTAAKLFDFTRPTRPKGLRVGFVLLSQKSVEFSPRNQDVPQVAARSNKAAMNQSPNGYRSYAKVFGGVVQLVCDWLHRCLGRILHSARNHW